MIKSIFITVIIFILTIFSTLKAGQVSIIGAEFKDKGQSVWSVSVTLKHSDTDWEHYADSWRIIDTDGNVLGERILRHPHIDEQPFTRSLRSVIIAQDIKTVYIEAHDKKHGWSLNRLKVELPQNEDHS